MSVWHNNGSNDSTLEKETLKIYNVLEDLNYGSQRIHAEFCIKFAKSIRRLYEELGASKDTIHRQIKTLGKS